MEGTDGDYEGRRRKGVEKGTRRKMQEARK
jgi:hypothetical protein